MFKVYRQIEHADCGFACVKMIAKFHGKDIPLNYLKKNVDYNRIGTSILDLKNMLSEIGMTAYALHLRKEDLIEMPLPAILYLGHNHFVVAYKIDKWNNFHIADPAIGKVKYTESELLSHWVNNASLPKDNSRGYAIIAEPTKIFFEKEYPKENEISLLFRSIKQHLHDFKYRFIFSILILCALMAMDLALPILFQHTIDEGIGGKDLSIVIAILLAQLGITLGTLFGKLSYEVIMTKIGIALNQLLVKDFLKKLIKLPISFFDKKSSPDFIQRVDDQTKIKDFISSFPRSVIFSTISFILFGIMLCYYSPINLLIFLGFTSIEIIWNILFLKRSRVIDSEKFSFTTLARNQILELIYGIQDLKIHKGDQSHLDKWENHQNKINDYNLQSLNLSNIKTGGSQFITGIRDLSIMGLCATMVIGDTISLGVMFTISFICGRLSSPVQDLSLQLLNIQMASMAHQRIEDINNEIKINHKTDRPIDCSIDFANVSFKYPGSGCPVVLKNLSFKIRQGETVALVGESGCGKSTIIKLMLGLYSPTSGQILLGKVSSSDIDENEWLNNCSAVMQSGYIFSDSLEKNINLSSYPTDLHRLDEAIHNAGLTDLYSRLPMKYRTPLGATGLELSGGQKQRVLIARAIYKQPQILILDEATSSLDANHEKYVIDKIKESSEGRTTIIAAHRLSTIVNADKILYIENGEIKEEGTHSELMSKRGAYYNLVSKQTNSNQGLKKRQFAETFA